MLQDHQTAELLVHCRTSPWFILPRHSCLRGSSCESEAQWGRSTPYMKKEPECWMWRRLYVQYDMCMYIQVDKYFNLFTSDLFMNSSCLKYWKTPKGLTALRSGNFQKSPSITSWLSWHFPPIFCSTFQLFAENPQWKGCFKTLGKPMGLAYLKNSIRCFLAHWPRRHLLPKNWTSKDGEVQRWVAQPTQFGNATTAARNNHIIANKIRFQWNICVLCCNNPWGVQHIDN